MTKHLYCVNGHITSFENFYISSPKDDFPNLAEIHTLAMVFEKMKISQTRSGRRTDIQTAILDRL